MAEEQKNQQPLSETEDAYADTNDRNGVAYKEALARQRKADAKKYTIRTLLWEIGIFYGVIAAAYLSGDLSLIFVGMVLVNPITSFVLGLRYCSRVGFQYYLGMAAPFAYLPALFFLVFGYRMEIGLILFITITYIIISFFGCGIGNLIYRNRYHQGKAK